MTWIKKAISMAQEMVQTALFFHSPPASAHKATKSVSDNNTILDSFASRFDFLKVNGWKSEYVSVDLLLKRLSRKCKSEASRKAYLNRLYLFCYHTKMAPDALISLPKKRIEVLIQDHVDMYNDGSYSIRYLNNILALLVGFFQSNGFKRSRALDVEGFYMPARYRKTQEYIPSKNEIYLMADCASSLRDRAIILTLYSSGFRNSTLRALLVRDVEEELSKGYYNIRLPCYPEMKLIDPYACKGNVPFFTFTCDEATQAIRLYLRERKEKYGEIRSQEPLLTSDYNQIDKEERRFKVLSSRQLQLIVKGCAQNAALPQWNFVKPHCIRKASETVYHSELVSGGLLDSKTQEFFMGHILPGSQDTYFDKTKTENLRAQFAKLNFGRVVVENKFKVLRTAVARAFEGSGIDPEDVISEYARMRAAGSF
jgi:integrase